MFHFVLLRLGHYLGPKIYQKPDHHSMCQILQMPLGDLNGKIPLAQNFQF